jgi:hypothetical protein
MRKDTYKTMRAVCKDIDNKILRHYGQEWCKEQHVILEHEKSCQTSGIEDEKL